MSVELTTSPPFDLRKGDRVTVNGTEYVITRVRLQNGTDTWTYELEPVSE